MRGYRGSPAQHSEDDMTNNPRIHIAKAYAIVSPAGKIQVDTVSTTRGQCSASNMRHVVEGVGKISRAALNQKGEA